MAHDPQTPSMHLRGDAGYTTPAPARRSAAFIVFLVMFIDLLGFGIVLPLLPLYAEDLLEPLFPGRGSVHGVLLGLLMASFSAMQFIFAPVWGRVSDRAGRRPILLLGLTGSVVFYTLFGIASEAGAAGRPGLGLLLLFVARLGAGIAGATISTAQAVIADTTTPETRARGMGLIGAAFGIGFTFGPLLGIASLFSARKGAPGFLAAGVSLAALVLAAWLMPETRRAGIPGAARRRLSRQGFRLLLDYPGVGMLVATFFLATLAFGSLESTLALVNKLLLTGRDEGPALTLAAARTTERGNFLVFAYVGFVLMLVQGLFYRRFVQRVGEVRFMRAGLVLMILGLVGAIGVLALRLRQPDRTAVWDENTASAAVPRYEGQTGLMPHGLAVMTVAVVGFALLTPSVQSLVSRRSDPDKQGDILGVNQAGAALARILGPAMALPLYKLSPSHMLPFGCSAGLLVVAFIMSLRISQE